MAYPAITPSAPAPQRTQAGDAYAATADTWAAYIEGLPDEMNALAQWMQDTAASLVSSGLSATSSASLTIGTGSKSFAASAGAAFTPGQSVVIASTANPANSMTGQITAYNSSTGNITVNVASVSGSGTFASWTIGLALVADLSGYLAKAGGTMIGLLTLAAAMGLVLTPGAAPGSPVDGQIWRETNKLMARVGAVSFEVVLATLAQTLTNKTLTSPVINGGTISSPTITGPAITGGTISTSSIMPRVALAGVTAGTLTPNCDTTDVFKATGLTAAVTLAAPTGTPTSEQKLTIYLKDNGTSRAITWTTSAGGFRAAKDVILPTATTAGKWVRIGCWRNLDDGYWDVLTVVAQA